jgi:chromate transporter
MPDEPDPDARPDVTLGTIAREWGRIGCTGFGGPPAHIALLRRLVEREGWLDEAEFEDAIAATNLLPGPASTQLAIYCAWRLRGLPGALIGGACFICPGLAAIVALAAVFLAAHPPVWITGAALGAGAVVAAVALNAAVGLAPASWRRAGSARAGRVRWVLYALAGGTAAATLGTLLVLVLLGCGLVEAAASGGLRPSRRAHAFVAAPLGVVVTGGLGALAWVAFKVGALSFGGGFVIIPLMQADAVHHYHWMTNSQFLNAVALGQITPGPVVQTVAVVGYAAAGVGGALLAALVAFAPSFALILGGARHFGALRANRLAQGFLGGAGPAAIGAIAGASIPLALAIAHVWQVEILAGALVLIVGLRRSVVLTLVGAGVLGAVGAALGLPIGG